MHLAARLAPAQQHALAAEASPASKVRLDGCQWVVQVEDPVPDRVGLRAQRPEQRPVDAVAAIGSAAWRSGPLPQPTCSRRPRPWRELANRIQQIVFHGYFLLTRMTREAAQRAGCCRLSRRGQLLGLGGRWFGADGRDEGASPVAPDTELGAQLVPRDGPAAGHRGAPRRAPAPVQGAWRAAPGAPQAWSLL